MLKEEVYVSHTCRICGKAFLNEDELDIQNISPDYIACPECCKTNKRKDLDRRNHNIKLDALYTYVFEHTPKEYIQYQPFLLDKSISIFNKFLEKNKRINSRNIFNQSKEVLEYILEDENDNIKNYVLTNI
jgi:DNA-directed RNA polymerase subunit RPC12/RpoP